MAATIKGITTLVFGCATISAVVVQSTDATLSREIVYAQDETGDYKAFAILGAGKCEASGEALYKGSEFGTLAATITVNSPSGSGGLYLYELGRKSTNTGFERCSFKAGGVEGVS